VTGILDKKDLKAKADAIVERIPLHDLTVESDERLKEMLPGDTTTVEDLVKLRELFTF
jgi:hypothetical protein